MLRLLEEDNQVLAWWGAPLEIATALARREREGMPSADQVADALRVAGRFANSWHEVVPSDSGRRAPASESQNCAWMRIASMDAGPRSAL